MPFCNYVSGKTDVFGPRIYDTRFGYRYFKTEQERDEYYDNAQWIDQKHWHKQNG